MIDIKRIPVLVRLFALIDLGLATLSCLDALLGDPSFMGHLGSPWGYVSVLIGLGGEVNIPAWYSSMKLALLALLFAGLTYYRFETARLREKLALLVLPAIFFALSFDEMASMHETVSEWLLTHHVLQKIPWLQGWYGSWVLVLAPALIPGLLAIIYTSRVYFRDRARMGWIFVLGLALLLSSALGLEQLGNLISDDTAVFAILQVTCEEFGEMMGVTVMIGAVVGLIESYGLRLLSEPTTNRILLADRS